MVLMISYDLRKDGKEYKKVFRGIKGASNDNCLMTAESIQ